MKLTKGRIIKVLSKNKQTMKRCKSNSDYNSDSSNNKNNNRNTIRNTIRNINRKSLNLRVKTLKHY